jgi:hypothetical protein
MHLIQLITHIEKKVVTITIYSWYVEKNMIYYIYNIFKILKIFLINLLQRKISTHVCRTINEFKKIHVKNKIFLNIPKF